MKMYIKYYMLAIQKTIVYLVCLPMVGVYNNNKVITGQQSADGDESYVL